MELVLRCGKYYLLTDGPAFARLLCPLHRVPDDMNRGGATCSTARSRRSQFLRHGLVQVFDLVSTEAA